MLVLSILATVPSILAAPGVLIDAKSEYLSGQSATIICSVDNNNVHIGSLAWWRTGPSDVEEWVGNSLVQKGDDDLYTVTDTLYNSAISNANIDVRFYNETDSSQSTLTVENVETDYDNLFNYFCKVQFNDPERGMIADLKASDKESFAVFEQPSQPFFTRTDKMNGEATYVCQTTHAGVPMTDLDLRLQVVDTDSYGKKRLVEDIPTTLLEGNKVVRGTFKIKPKHATAIVQCIADHTSNNLDGAVELEPAQDFFKKLTPLAGPRRDVNVTVNGHLETKAALIYDPLAPMPRTADSIQFMEPIFNDPKIGEDGSCTVRFQVLIPDSINPQPARRWYVNDQLTQGAGNEFVYKVRKNEAADITFAAMSPLGDEHITTNVDQDCFPPPPPEVAQAPAGATGTLSIVIIIIIVIVIIVIAVIIAVMIKRKNESEEDEESGDKNDLDETAGSITYQPGNSRSEIQG